MSSPLLQQAPHHWSGAYGIAGGTERWEHGSYRWRRAVEIVLVLAVSVALVPAVLVLAGLVLVTSWQPARRVLLALMGLRPLRRPARRRRR